MNNLTEAQSKMLSTIDSIVVRRSYERNGQPIWLVGGRRATAGEARVISALQTKRLVKVVSENVRITGWVGTKAVARLVRK